MALAPINGIALEYSTSGAGAPVVFIHGAFIADVFRPLVSEIEAAGRWRLITYHRRGYGGSTHAAGPTTMQSQSQDCRALLRYLQVERAHVVGHSFGASVALQLALDEPLLVHSLVLLEPGLFVGESAQSYRDALLHSARRFREEGAAPVMEAFFRARWPLYSRAALDAALPGAFEQAVADAGTFFDADLGALEWGFGDAEARRVRQPALVVLGGGSEALHPRFRETYDLLLGWLPNAEGFILPDASHFLHLEDPGHCKALGAALSAFFAQHPFPPNDASPSNADAGKPTEAL